MNLRFLIVDDEPAIQNLVRLILKPYGHCVTADNGSDAILKYNTALNQERAFDLIILDIMMPIMTGIQALEKIRKIERELEIKEVDGVKVIMLTASDDTPDVLDAFSYHVDAYLIKPFESEELISEIQKLGLID